MSRLPLKQSYRRSQAKELIRQQQQGLGRPITSIERDGQRSIAIGKARTTGSWKLFTNFLDDHIKSVLGADWWESELEKADSRHPILVWHQSFHSHVSQFGVKDGEAFSVPPTGALCCYLGLAYNLYLIQHNVELERRLVRRLLDPRQFQGAYYELAVANCLIRAGFELTLEDETDKGVKHCEFSAISKISGKRYWIEAKMRSVTGLLGKTRMDGTGNGDPTRMLTEHLRLALRKPAKDQRLIFIDINAATEANDVAIPTWTKRATQRMVAREKDTPKDKSAYVLITNFAFHRHLDDRGMVIAALAYGLNIPDFGKPGTYSLSEAYRAKQRHQDAYRLVEALRTYPKIPVTFDGTLASEFAGGGNRIRIGERHAFDRRDGREGRVVGIVQQAIVAEDLKRAFVQVLTDDGEIEFALQDLTDEQFSEYLAHKDAYFGEIRPAQRNLKDNLEMSEWLVDQYSRMPRERIIELCKAAPDLSELRQLTKEDLVLEYAERMMVAIRSSGHKGQ